MKRENVGSAYKMIKPGLQSGRWLLNCRLLNEGNQTLNNDIEGLFEICMN